MDTELRWPNLYLRSHNKKGIIIYSLDRHKFSEVLLKWYDQAKRDLPWRRTKDPYVIWLSEIILQQTRVDQGLPYWKKFIDSFPSVHDLAKANEEEVLRLWQGLGYYSRARKLHQTAKDISDKLDGEFPEKSNELVKLKGIGPYTAAAIASICFNEAVPVIDGNVFRFASRYFGIKENTADSKNRKVFEEILLEFISKDFPGNFNQAMMEFGSIVCAPKANCNSCDFINSCFAYNEDMVNSLPLKSKKVKVKERYINYFVFVYDNNWLFKKRVDNDIWQGLYDFYLVEGKISEEEVLNHIKSLSSKFTLQEISQSFKHILSHQKIYATFYLVQVSKKTHAKIATKLKLEVVKSGDIINLPKPKLIVNYLSSLSNN